MGLSLHLIPDHHSVKHCSHILHTLRGFFHHSVKQCSHILHPLRGFSSSQCQALLTHLAYPQRLFVITVSNIAHTSCIPSQALRHHSVKQCSHIVHTLRGFTSSQCQTALTHCAYPQRLFTIRVSNSAHTSCIPSKAFLQPSVSGRDVP